MPISVTSHWEPEVSEEQKTTERRIVAAAIYFGAVISLPPPARHHTILQSMLFTMGIGDEKIAEYLQGFLTSDGQYVNRVEAFYIAHKAGQLKRNSSGRPELYSEDLWDDEIPG